MYSEDETFPTEASILFTKSENIINNSITVEYFRYDVLCGWVERTCWVKAQAETVRVVK